MSEEKKDTKPGYKTTEFWLTLVATLCGLAMASGFIAEGSDAAQYIGGALALLAQLGYTGARATVKKSQ